MSYTKPVVVVKQLVLSVLSAVLLVSCVPRGASQGVCIATRSADGKDRLERVVQRVATGGFIAKPVSDVVVTERIVAGPFVRSIPDVAGKCERESGTYCQQVVVLKTGVDEVSMVLLTEIANSSELSSSAKSLLADIEGAFGNSKVSCPKQ